MPVTDTAADMTAACEGRPGLASARVGLVAYPGHGVPDYCGLPVISRSTGRLASAHGNGSQKHSRR
jgi:hypothetical protein